MTNRMEAAVKAGAFAINPYPFQGGLAALGHIHIGHGETWDEAVQREKRSAEYKAYEVITSALPHIRAMIAEEIVRQHQDYVCTNYENPGDDDHPRACVWEIIENITHQLTGTNQITDNAAQNAERSQP